MSIFIPSYQQVLAALCPRLVAGLPLKMDRRDCVIENTRVVDVFNQNKGEGDLGRQNEIIPTT